MTTDATDIDDRDERRGRLIAAFSKAAGEQGYSRLDVERVSRYAGLPPAGFYEQFGSLEEALVAAQEAFLGRLWTEVTTACEEVGLWPFRVRAVVAAVIGSLVESSSLSRVFAIEAPAASLVAAERQFAALDRLAGLLAEGRKRYPRAQRLPAITERVLIGGGVSVISQYLLAEDPKTISALREQLVAVLLAPYLGEEEARRVAAG
ncbi:MAG TPA: TetR/AcrR family transcriptional regulator [Solirubrobacterales bacterium]|nr:TetR/AcrR family transcriptional regulator [Solirubrobacterales bacterium]